MIKVLRKPVGHFSLYLALHLHINVLLVHLYKFISSGLACPILRSGLSSFALRSSQMAPLSLFHRKCLKGFLHLSKSAPTPAIHFLFGEPPMEAKIHRDMFSLFYSVWQNPNTKVHQMIKIILSEANSNSSTFLSTDGSTRKVHIQRIHSD